MKILATVETLNTDIAGLYEDGIIIVNSVEDLGKRIGEADTLILHNRFFQNSSVAMITEEYLEYLKLVYDVKIYHITEDDVYYENTIPRKTALRRVSSDIIDLIIYSEEYAPTAVGKFELENFKPLRTAALLAEANDVSFMMQKASAIKYIAADYISVQHQLRKTKMENQILTQRLKINSANVNVLESEAMKVGEYIGSLKQVINEQADKLLELKGSTAKINNIDIEIGRDIIVVYLREYSPMPFKYVFLESIKDAINKRLDKSCKVLCLEHNSMAGKSVAVPDNYLKAVVNVRKSEIIMHDYIYAIGNPINIVKSLINTNMSLEVLVVYDALYHSRIFSGPYIELGVVGTETPSKIDSEYSLSWDEIEFNSKDVQDGRLNPKAFGKFIMRDKIGLLLDTIGGVANEEV